MITDISMDLLKHRIKTCYHNLLIAKSEKYSELYIEGFRSRLDELLLLYHLTKKITFIEACKELNIKYEDVNAQDIKK